MVDGAFVTTFNVKLDGVNSNSLSTLYRAYAHWDLAALQTTPPTLITTGQRTQFTVDTSAILASLGSGNYTATIPAAYVIDNADYLFIMRDDVTGNRTAVTATLGATSLRDLVSDSACASCHGPTPAWNPDPTKFRHYPIGGSKCQICHSITSREVGIITLLDNGTRVQAASKYGTNAVEYFHGIHKSETMPDGAYFRSTNPTGGENNYVIGYPSDMRNCKVCHSTPAQQTAASTAPVSWYLCMTCHQKWDGFVHVHAAANGSYAAGDPIFAAGDFHRTFTSDATNCMTCHVELPTMNQAGKFHNDFQGTDAHYDSFYNGSDISYDNPDNVLFAIQNVIKAGDNVTFTWTASRGGAAVDPCNATVAGASFRGLGAYLAYAKGDDWVNDNVGTSPGQPASSKNLFTSLATTCSSNVATTTGLRIAAGAKTYATKVLLGIGGKALDNVAVTIGGVATTKQIFVRVPSPTRAFSMTDGTNVAVTQRRNIVDSSKCLGCHRGTMYQHGGDRIDNAQLCVVCHNPSSSEKNNRLYWQVQNADGTVNTSKTYDGKSAETYDLKYLLHAIHGVEPRGFPIVIYRTRGIMAFAPEGVDQPTGWPADGMSVYGSLNDGQIAHTWTVVDYPKPASDCLGCHFAGTYEVADQTKAAPVTIEPGTSWPLQSDDISIGPSAAACTACHAASVVRSHAKDQGYMAIVIKQNMIAMSEADAWWVFPNP
ncbi:MAG: hypothetical protein D4R80_00505 [Deltaproteobacteria bacterium]|nr:MAG: hypothetical protein D4R80_00505 [Deltaproteobacteria bacterium]